MLLLILEIGLTISAWQRGWKGWALLPGAFALAGGYMLGMVLGGDSSVDFFSVGIIIDILCVIALIIMVSKRAVSMHLRKPQLSMSKVSIFARP